jgi:tRNA pseudouridine(55) synthase
MGMSGKTEVLQLYKSMGETPLECIERFRANNPQYKETTMTYLGRLDPMAEGLLLVLAGDTRDKKKYLEWDKTYEFEVLWGFETDTYDVLGLVTETSEGKMPKKLEERMPKLLDEIASKKTQVYPPYSSRTVGGLPLFSWAREGKIKEINIPTRNIKIFNILHRNTRLLNKEVLLAEIISRIDLVKGDFRQEQIIGSWQEKIRLLKEQDVFLSSFTASVSSGTYIRGLAHTMGEFFGTGSLAYSIKRTRVGEYNM